MPVDTVPGNPESKPKSAGPAGARATDAGRSAGSPQAAENDLEVQVARLREDVAGVADALKSLAGERAEGARRQAYALRDDVRDRGERYVRQAQDAASEIEAQLSEKIRAEPIKSVLIAAAIGYVYARLFKH